MRPPLAIRQPPFAMAGAVALLVVLGGACEKPAGEELTPVLNVHGLIKQGRNSCWRTPVFVNRTYAIGEEPEAALDNAEVLMWNRYPGETLGFAPYDLHDRTAYYCTTLYYIPARSRDTWWLRVSHEGLDTVWARTVVPDTFRILYPARGDTVSDGDSLVFTRSRNASGYMVSYDYDFQGEHWRGWFAFPNESIPGVPYDSLIMRLPMLWLRTVMPYWPYELVVAALDSNYFEWAGGTGNDPRRNREFLSAGVIGGIGVFGSLCETSCTLYVRPESTYRRGGFEGPRGQGFEWRSGRSSPAARDHRCLDP